MARKGRKWNGKINIVHYVTRQYMYQNKKRTFTTFTGIVFMVLLMTCVFVGKDTAISCLQDIASVKDGKWHYAMYHVTSKQEEQARNLPYMKEMSESVGLGMTAFPQSANEERPYLNVKAYGTQCFDWYNIKLLSGRLPERADELVLSAACLDDGADIKPGDIVDAAFFERSVTGIQKNGEKRTIFPYYDLEVKKGETVKVPENFPYFGKNESFLENIEMTGKQKSYTVVGFVETPSFEKEHAAGYTAFTFADDETLSRADTMNVTMLVDLRKAPDNCILELFKIAGEENVEVNDVYLAFSGDSADSTMNLMVHLMTLFFVLLIMIASAILIYNVFNLSFQERSRYLGMLSSVGATARQKRSSIYYEAFHLLFAALPTGIFAGFGVVKSGMALLMPYMQQFIYTGAVYEKTPVVLKVSWEALLAVVLASILTVLVSAFLPARKIGKIGAYECIRGNEDKKNRMYKMNRKTSGRFFVEKMLAKNSIVRQKRKRRSVSLAIIIFLVILLVTAFGADTIHIILENKTANSMIVDTKLGENEYILLNWSQNDAESESRAREQFHALKEEISQYPGVEHIKEWYDSIFFVNLNDSFYSEEFWNAYLDIAEAYLGDELTREEIRKQYITDSSFVANLLVVDDDTLKDMAKRCGANYDLLADKEKKGVIVINETVLSTDSLGFEGKKPKRYLYYDIERVSDLQQKTPFPAGIYSQLTQRIEEMEFTVAGYADNDQLADYVTVEGEWPWFIMSKETANQVAIKCGYTDVSEMMEESLHIQMDGENEDLVTYLKDIAEHSDNIGFTAWDDPDLEKTMMETIADMVDIMLICFVILTSVICLMNLVNSIRGRMADRRKDFAILKSVGMTRVQLRRMLLFECSSILLEAAVIAAVISVVLIWIMRYVLSTLFGHLVLRIPYLLILLAIAFTMGAVVILTLHSFGSVKEENLLENIRSESV